MADTVNVPYKSRWIGGMYASLTVFIILLFFILYLFVEPYMQALNGAVLFIFALMLFITISFYTTKYKIEDGFLKAWSPFMNINLKLKNVKKVEKILVPIHFRVGASLYSGNFYVPSIGWVMSIITNLRDAVLITTKDGRHYMITPSNPKGFIKKLK